ncbi:protein antagonist of like heterochromatin protein 1 [Plakobranchus ocellatus]|uniref:Protein antagonist of like heterochromatin protein 1 n=1 Tax=Plakobranchus ocellatus TaxID=259542 RepID=A0AAV3ZA35_9GAST|nr:protein antagonist of like heterochromatin protein 1 [Plakobranchus ocellatus]
MTNGDLIGIHKSTVSRIVHWVASAIAAKRRDFVTFPVNAELNNVKQDFYEIAGFPGVIGCIDCTHIRIIRPSAEIYRNRKGYFSINVQAVCDTNLRISSLVARWPGSTHDTRIFYNSVLSMRLENRELNGHLLGDNGYPNLPYLLTPILNPGNRGEQRYNISHKTTRNTIERLFGVLKRRFPALHYGIRFSLR